VYPNWSWGGDGTFERLVIVIVVERSRKLAEISLRCYFPVDMYSVGDGGDDEANGDSLFH